VESKAHVAGSKAHVAENSARFAESTVASDTSEKQAAAKQAVTLLSSDSARSEKMVTLDKDDSPARAGTAERAVPENRLFTVPVGNKWGWCDGKGFCYSGFCYIRIMIEGSIS
jgi:hypothetical protein